MATTTKTTHELWQDLLLAAHVAGHAAARGATPTPMVVGTPRNMAASLLGGDDGGFDPNEPTFYVSEGVCGFAWLNFKGNRRFLNWLVGRGKTAFPASDVLSERTEARLGEARTDTYYKGVSVWVGGYGQSMARKEAYARAFARVVNEAGVEGLTVMPMSRMD